MTADLLRNRKAGAELESLSTVRQANDFLLREGYTTQRGGTSYCMQLPTELVMSPSGAVSQIEDQWQLHDRELPRR